MRATADQTRVNDRPTVHPVTRTVHGHPVRREITSPQDVSIAAGGGDLRRWVAVALDAGMAVFETLDGQLLAVNLRTSHPTSRPTGGRGVPGTPGTPA